MLVVGFIGIGLKIHYRSGSNQNILSIRWEVKAEDFWRMYSVYRTHIWFDYVVVSLFVHVSVIAETRPTTLYIKHLNLLSRLHLQWILTQRRCHLHLWWVCNAFCDDIPLSFCHCVLYMTVACFIFDSLYGDRCPSYHELACSRRIEIFILVSCKFWNR